MKALILAGGMGDRLGSLTDHQPKALVPIAGKALICYTLDLLKVCGIESIGLVVGYHPEKLVDFIHLHYPTVEIFRTPDYDQGSILGMQCAHSFLDDDFLLMNVDHIYPKKLLTSVLHQVKGITAACDFDRTLIADDMKIKKDRHGKLKKIHKQLTDFDGGYIGMTYCHRSKLPSYLEGSKTALKKLGRKACVEMALAELATQEPIDIADTSGMRWLEVDTLQDLTAAENTLREEKDFLL